MSAARNNRRRRKKRGRFGFLYKLLAFVALAAALVVGATVFFRVETVRVEGNVRYDAQQVVQASGVVQGDNLFAMNKFDTARQIRQLLPYVEEVSIRRDLPDTLVIRVQECRAAAWLESWDGVWLLSAAGKVLEKAERAGEDVIQLKGLEFETPEAGAMLTVSSDWELRLAGALALLEALEGSGLDSQVTCIDLSSPSRIVMDYTDRFTVKLPVNGDYDYLLRAMKIAADKLESYESGTLDLTVKDYTVVFGQG